VTLSLVRDHKNKPSHIIMLSTPGLPSTVYAGGATANFGSCHVLANRAIEGLKGCFAYDLNTPQAAFDSARQL